MCLVKLSTANESKLREQLPDVFPCWRLVYKNGENMFGVSANEEITTEKGVHIAVLHQRQTTCRMPIDYAPGYHVYLSRADASNDAVCWNNYHNMFDSKLFVIVVRKFWANKCDIVMIGLRRYDGRLSSEQPTCLAVSKITRK